MVNEKFLSCIDACNFSASACDLCAAACLGEEDAAELTHCVRLDSDCAAVCRLTAELLARGSEFSSAIAVLCAEVCEACSDECERHADMEHCRICAEACRQCARECRIVATMTQVFGIEGRGAVTLLSAH